MHIVIIGIVCLIIFILLARSILFNPRVNSVLHLLAVIYILYIGINSGSPLLILLSLIIIIDCIRDIVMAKKYYRDIDISVDKLFVIKSLTAIPLLLTSRIIFLLFVYPLISLSVSSDFRRKIKSGHPLPHKSLYSKLEARNYYFGKLIDKALKKSNIVGNIETVDEEAKISRIKLANLYPEKILAMIIDLLPNEKKEKRKAAENALSRWDIKNNYAYLPSAVFEKYPGLITEVMSQKGVVPPWGLSRFEELKPLSLSIPIGYDNNERTRWGEYFIVKALNPLVSDGTFEDLDFSDEILDNHAYRYSKSKVTMPSIDANNDPRFALDDD